MATGGHRNHQEIFQRESGAHRPGSDFDLYHRERPIEYPTPHSAGSRSTLYGKAIDHREGVFAEESVIERSIIASVRASIPVRG